MPLQEEESKWSHSSYIAASSTQFHVIINVIARAQISSINSKGREFHTNVFNTLSSPVMLQHNTPVFHSSSMWLSLHMKRSQDTLSPKRCFHLWSLPSITDALENVMTSFPMFSHIAAMIQEDQICQPCRFK